jgi:uncharacterized protein (TIGR03000 family)
MWTKLTTFGVFAVAGLTFLLAPDTAFAQRWRGAGPRLEGRGLDIGGGYYGSGYYGSPYYGSSYYSGYSYPSQYTSMYFSGDMEQAQAENRVILNIQAPAGANLWIGDVFVGQGDSNRQFISPPLEYGRPYIYDVKARWMQDGREVTSTRSFWFQGGQTNLSFDLFQGAQYQSAYPPSRAGEGLAEGMQDLHLTDAQEAKIADIRNESRPKIHEAGKQLAAILKEEQEKVRDVLSPEQMTKLATMKEERRERLEGLAERIAHLKDLDLTEAELAKIQAIRNEYRPKITRAMEGLNDILTPAQKKAREEALKAGKNRRAVLASLNLTADQREKVEAVCKDVAAIVREELEQIKYVLTEEQQAKLPDLRDERKESVRDRWASAVVNLKDLNLTEEQKYKIQEIRKEYRPKVQDAGNKLRAEVREAVESILAVMK